MRTNKHKSFLARAGLAASVLLLASSATLAQQVNVTAKGTTTTLPDGTTVPMWGLFCNDAGSAGASCTTVQRPSTVTPAAWAAGKAYVVGQAILDASGNVQVVTTAGTSGGGPNPPAFGTAPGATTSGDGTVTWTAFGTLAQYQAGFSATWAPPVITVGSGSSLTINLTNSLVFTPPIVGATPNNIPTSLTIVGQLGGGLGSRTASCDSTSSATTGATCVPSPDHTNAQPVTWPIAGTPPGAAPVGTGTPPLQGPRVQSFSTEVAAGTTAALCWGAACSTGAPALKPGTYLIESGTHPSIQGPMGLYGILVVTTAPNGTTPGTAYPGVAYNAEIPLLLSEIDPLQNTAVDTAVRTAGFSETATLGLVFKAPLLSISVDSGGSGYTSAPGVTFSGGGGSGAHATAIVDTTVGSPTYQQVTAITLDNVGSDYTSPPQIIFSGGGSGGGAAATASLALGANNIANCADATGVVKACYPPAVNYTPLYYLINGHAFDKTNPPASVFSPSPATAVTGSVLVRLVNAGLRMHVPSIVGAQTGAAVSGFSLIAEDGNVLPGVPRVQSEVFMAAGKTYDVAINAVNAPPSTTALPIYDRELSLSANSIARDAGMLAYIGVNGSTTGATVAAAAATATANPDSYSYITGHTLIVSDPGKGVIANDIGIAGVHISGTVPAGLTLNADGTFVYSGNTDVQFNYCGNGQTSGPACTTVTLAACTTNTCLEAGTGIHVIPITYTANATFLKIQPPGILSVDSDDKGYPLTVQAGSVVAQSGLTVSVDSNGGFSAFTAAAGGTYSFAYRAQNAQGTPSGTALCDPTVTVSGCAIVTVNFPAATGLAVSVLDGKDALAATQAGKTLDCTATPAPLSCITDYRWIIEEDRTFYVNPNCATNPPPPGSDCPGAATGGIDANGNPITGIVPTFGTNFHTSYMPLVAAGCTGMLSCEGGQTIFDNNQGSATFGQHINAVCDQGNGVCRPDTTGNGFAPTFPSSVHLDPTKRYYLTIFPGDAGNDFANGNLTPDCTNGVASAQNPGACGHGMSGAPIVPTCTGAVPTATTCSFNKTVVVLTEPAPYPPSQLSVFVFEDDFPLNGEVDGAGGVDVIAPQEPGLGGFNITLFDDAGGTGDATGQMTYDMFNQPLVNGLAGTIDPATKQDACPISKISRIGPADPSKPFNPKTNNDKTQTGITGTIVTCPKYEADGKTLSPLAGQAVIPNLMPGRYGVVATPGADRIARGEEWLQTNTLDGQKAHDSFLRIGEPSFFQEFGPAGYHVTIGFANPKIITARKQFVCNGRDVFLPGLNNTCFNRITGFVSTERMSRTPDERLYGSGSNQSFAFTQCYVSLGDPDGEDFAFTKCDGNGNFTLDGIPDGTWRITVFDQWNDMLVDGLSTPVSVHHAAGATAAKPTLTNIGEIAMNQWQANIYTSTFFDANGNGVRDSNETGLTLVPTNIRFRDGSYSNFNNTDLNGNAGFNEVFPLFAWYVIETDSTRYKSTGTHVVYDAGGPADGTCTSATAPCNPDANGAYANMANTVEQVSLPAGATAATNLRVPGAVYCATADCASHSIKNGPGDSDNPSTCTTDNTGATTCSPTLSTGRIDPSWVASEGWQGFSGQNSFIDFGKAPFTPGENGGIHGEVIYASTRPFDDPQLLLHTSWTPDVPGVTINLYKVGTAPDGSQSLTLVDTTTTSSWDDWAQEFYPGTSKPYMNCPGQMRNPTSSTAGDLFFFTLFNQPNYLDLYNSQHGGPASTQLPDNAQFKCYDGMHNWNQVQPAPYDGAYQFPSIVTRDPLTGLPKNPPQIAGNPTGTGSQGSMAGTNCTICTPDPTDPTQTTPMLPSGQYVVEMVVPPGYELVKEEDKNILIGDNYIAPVTQEFPGLGSAIYIMPDQASVAAIYNANQPVTVSGYNSTNAQNPTQAFGRISSLPSHEGDTGSVETFWPCVGQARIVPDYISLFPQSHEVAPFAGALRNLCDRKLVQLDDQSSVLAKFWVFTSAHVASHFTGAITDDFTSEFDPFAPTFGEKFSPASMPISIKDWTGQEISRVYSDQWGAFNGLTYSTWEVNPPNPTGYAPTMMVTCMNDPGTGATPDPFYDPAYSQFCYEIPFMPGQTQYMDTPVVPTSAFVGAGYNNPDCAYPDATPAVSEVDGDGIGPWVSDTGSTHTLTIYALGDVTTNNYAYSGPSATTSPFNKKTVTRHYGFGSSQGAGYVAYLNSDGSPHKLTTVTSWSDTKIQLPVSSANFGSAPLCPVQQQAQYGGPGNTVKPVPNARCAQLVIVGSNGKQSIDTVTVTIGGKAPTHVAPTASVQAAIDAAHPGDLLILDPTTSASVNGTITPAVHQEILLMWKPVRLQGVGAAGSVINANAHPAGKIDSWRQRVNCLFGLALNGQPATSSNPYDATGAAQCPGTGWSDFKGNSANPQVDRVPLEAILGWDVTVNGNLAELLQEPSLMGAYEGAGITVLAKGVNIAGGDAFGSGAEAAFPAGSTLLSGSTDTLSGNLPVGDANNNCHTLNSRGRITSQTNPFPSNFSCNPSAIDGLTISNSSQGGGGIFVHGWGHNIQVANNRVTNNAGTLGGGINIGQGEFPEEYLAPQAGAPVTPPGSCRDSNITNLQLPYCLNLNVNVHHNAVTLNSSTGDELFSGTPAGAGGVNFCSGADYYKFNYNWVCGNLSSGDGGGFAHLGFSYNGDIEHNSVLFNQSTNPTIATNGGGIIVMGTAPDAPSATQIECGSVTDVDCQPGLSDGVGPGLVINANLIQGNAAESGSGGGLRLQNVNGVDVSTFPQTPANWYAVTVTNNIISNNVAGWDGGGVSLQDALDVNIINNTIASNDSTASSGVLFDTLGAPIASSGGVNCIQAGSTTRSCPQPAGLVSVQNSSNLTSAIGTVGGVTCPSNHPNCQLVSNPELYNNVIWQNRSFNITVGALGSGALNQQNLVTLVPTLNQPSGDHVSANGSGSIVDGGTGACVTSNMVNGTTYNVSYWDVGVRGDSGPSNHGSGFTLAPTYSLLTVVGGGYADPALHNAGSDSSPAANPTVVSQYCNGARVPPENGGLGYNVPPGIADATVPNPIFNLTPAATVDEGNNWINIAWGPLSLVNALNGATLGNYGPAAGSSAINFVPLAGPGASFYGAAPDRDFYGNLRKDGFVDAGAVEFAPAAATLSASVSPSQLAFGEQLRGFTSAPMTVTVTNTGSLSLAGGTFTVSGGGFPPPFSRPFGAAGGTCGSTLAAGASCTVNVVFQPAANATIGTVINRNLTVAYTGATVTGSPVALSGTPVANRIVANPASLDFGSVGADGRTSSAAQTVTIQNGTGSTRSLALAFSGLFSRATLAQGGTGTCGATLANGQSCTIRVVFTPTGAGQWNGSLTLTTNNGFVVTHSPVVLTGAGVAPVFSASLTPATWSPSVGAGCTTMNCPVQLFMLTNTGNATLTGISKGSVSGAGAGTFPITPFLSSCGPAGGGQFMSQTSLAPGASCMITLTFAPGTAGAKNATLSVHDALGTQSSALTGTAN